MVFLENMDWKKIREEFPILQNYTYLNSARFCALPKAVLKIQQRYIQGLADHGSWNFEEWSKGYEAARSLAAKLVNAEKDNVFFIPNVSVGINLASLYLEKRRVILLERDFPSVTLPWQSHGFEVTTVNYHAPDLYDQLERLLAQEGQILCLSWVQSADGFEIDLERIFTWCKAKDHTLVLDGTQGMGAIPIALDPEVSMVFLSSSFKWLLAGYGVAIGYVSNDLLPKFKAFQGWNSIDFGTGHAKTGAASLEVGNAMFFNVLGLHEGLKLIDEIGVDIICAKNLEYRNGFIRDLEVLGREVMFHYESRSSIFRIKADDQDYRKLKDGGVQTSQQSGAVRISPNFFNDGSDKTALIQTLQ